MKKREKVEKDKKYYREMLQKNRDNLIERYNKKFDKNLKETDFDFEKAKVMIIGPKFYKSQNEKILRTRYFCALNQDVGARQGSVFSVLSGKLGLYHKKHILFYHSREK